MTPFTGTAVVADALKIELRIAGVEGAGDNFKFHRSDFLKKMKDMEKDETVFPPGKSGEDPVVFFDQSEAADTLSR